MFRAKAGSRLSAANVALVIAAAPHVNRQLLPSGSPNLIEKIGAFQFVRQYQPKKPTKTVARTIEMDCSERESIQILNERNLATESSSSIEVGTSAREIRSLNFMNCQSTVAPSD